MNNKVTLLLIAVGLLLIIAAVLIVRLYQYKRQIKEFTKRINERLSVDMNQPVTVEYFDKDVLALADSLNEYTGMIKEKTLSIDKDRRMLKNVIAGISHDFRTPLTAAMGYMQMIEKNDVLDSKNKEYLHISMEKTAYLKALSDSFFEVSQIEANTEPVVFEKVNLTNILSEQVMGQYDWINEQNINVDIRIPEQDIVVDSNVHFVERIFENIFSNARKYTLSYLYVELSVSENNVLITVKNDMQHVDNFDVSRVFEAFYRDPARHSEGTGLGLYVVKCLSEKLSHRVSATCTNDIFGIVLAMDLPA